MFSKRIFFQRPDLQYVNFIEEFKEDFDITCKYNDQKQRILWW